MMMGKIVIKVINVRLQPGSWYNRLFELRTGGNMGNNGNNGKTGIFWRWNLTKLCRLKHDDF